MNFSSRKILGKLHCTYRFHLRHTTTHHHQQRSKKKTKKNSAQFHPTLFLYPIPTLDSTSLSTVSRQKRQCFVLTALHHLPQIYAIYKKKNLHLVQFGSSALLAVGSPLGRQAPRATVHNTPTGSRQTPRHRCFEKYAVTKTMRLHLTRRKKNRHPPPLTFLLPSLYDRQSVCDKSSSSSRRQ